MTIAPMTAFFTRFQPRKLAGYLDLLLQTANNVLLVVINLKFEVEQETPFYHMIFPSITIVQL